ncbi:MAG: cation:proton antiporter [Candidatus Thorarchaeota archaeon]|nr:cation:proton antiporter [Candidatus Thorarchaeota archaeon]
MDQFFLLTIGAALVLAYIGAFILKKAGIPQTLGFMIAGVVLALIGILTELSIENLKFFVALALGLIGYNIGHELSNPNLTRERIRRLLLIVIIEASAAFAVVAFLTFMILSFVGFSYALPTAILFGAVASATAPAATADVVWECECEGPVTSSLMFVLAADDIVAVILTNSAIAFALWVFVPGSLSFNAVLFEPVIGIIGSVVLGVVFGFIFLYPVNSEKDRGKLLELEIGMVILLIGVIEVLNGYFASLGLLIQISDIFAAMVFGYLVRSRIDHDKEQVPKLLERVMSPIVMIFFVMVGGKMALILTTSDTLLLIVLTAALYLGGRTIAKYFGTAIGSRIVNEVPAIQKYLGGCLLCQAGVALGLSFIIEETFLAHPMVEAQIIGLLILGVVALSTMILEMVGPMAVKMSLRAAGELPDNHATFEPHDITLVDIADNNASSASEDEDLNSVTDDENEN